MAITTACADPRHQFQRFNPRAENLRQRLAFPDWTSRKVQSLLRAKWSTGATTAVESTLIVEANLTVHDFDEHEPTVTAVVVNYNGFEHLPSCLKSLESLDYPSAKFSVLIVDNGSTDGSVEYLRSSHPEVRVHKVGANIGFAAAVDVGAEIAASEVLVLINNDLRVEPNWLREMLRWYAPDESTPCVASVILNWEGDRIDFVSGTINFHGFGDQPGYGLLWNESQVDDSAYLLFACGGAMLVSREVFLEEGGFDPGFFAYFEDVDFGWRLNITGNRVRLAANAHARHRHHGTSSKFPHYQRLRLLEANALRMILKNLDARHLDDWLGPALLLMLERSYCDLEGSDAEYEIGGRANDIGFDRAARLGLSRIYAAHSVVSDLPTIMRQRDEIQAKRSVPDSEIFQEFGQPLKPLGSDNVDYLRAFDNVVTAFGLDLTTDRARRRRVVFVAYETISRKMAGPAIRCIELAREVSKVADTVIASPERIDVDLGPVRHVEFSDENELRQIASDADVVVVFGYLLERYPCLRDMSGVLVADMYDPWSLEALEQLADDPDVERSDQTIGDAISAQQRLLSRADIIMCASSRQESYWRGVHDSIGFAPESSLGGEPSTDLNTITVPFGCPDQPPPAPSFDARSSINCPDDAPLLLWTGGVWDWFDPILVIDAFESTLSKHSDARLHFLGLQLDHLDVPKMRAVDLLRQRIDTLGLQSNVSLGDWVPYNDRVAFLEAADIGVMATLDLAEIRLAFRTRLLDHFWTGLPTVSTGGDSLTGLIDDHHAGIILEPGDVPGFADAIHRMIVDIDFRDACSEAASQLAESFRWSTVAKPLVSVIEAIDSDVTGHVPGRPHSDATRSLIAAQRDEIRRLRNESDSIQHKLDRFRRTPAYPAYRFAKKLGKAVRDRRP